MATFYLDKLTRGQILKIPFFENVPEHFLPDLQNLLQVNEYDDGEYVFCEGQLACKMYFMLQGWVKVVKKNLKGVDGCIAELCAPDFFGEMALIDRANRSAGIIAVSKLITAELDWEHFEKIFPVRPDLALYIYKKMALELSMRLRHANVRYTNKPH